MRFLSAISPKLTITRTRRKAVINEMTNLIILYETKLKVEISLPTIWQGIKDSALDLFSTLFMPKFVFA